MSTVDPHAPWQPPRTPVWRSAYNPHTRQFESPRKRVAKAGARGAGRAAWWTTKKAYRHRSKMWPVYTAICAGLVAEACGHVQDGWRTALVLGVLVGLAIGWRQLRARRDGARWSWPMVATTWAAWAATTAWVAEAAAHGALTVPIPGFLAVGALVGEIAWLWHIHARPVEREEIAAEVEAEETLDERVKKWVLKIARQGGVLPDSFLVDIHDLPDGSLGWEALIAMEAGGQYTTEHAIAATSRISNVYRVPPEQVVIEPPLGRLTNEARLMVLNRNPLVNVQRFTGPTLDLETGYFRAGVHADAAGALLRLFTPGSGANHAIVAGTTGAGKSGLVNVLCAEVRHSGCAILCLADPEDGESVPDWQDDGPHVFAGTIPKIRRMLQGVERVMEDRKKRRKLHTWTDELGRTRRGKGSFTPSPEEPLICVAIDEAPDVLGDYECARIIKLLGRKGRKYGICVWIFVQVPSLSELGGDLTIRSMLSSTNIVMFRTSDKLSAQMGAPSDLPIDPVNLPAFWQDGSTTAGLGYLATAGGKVAPMRGSYVEDPYHWATSGTPCRIPMTDISAAADEHGNYWLDWRELRNVEDADETAQEWVPDSPQAAAAIADRTKRAAGLNQPVLDLLARRGPTLTGTITTELERLGATKSSVGMCLARLRAKGLVYQVRYGQWALVAAEETADRELQEVSA